MVRVHWAPSDAVGAAVLACGLLFGAWVFDDLVPTLVFATGALVVVAYAVARMGFAFEVTDLGLSRVVWGRRTMVPWSDLQAWFCVRRGDQVHAVDWSDAAWIELSSPSGTWRAWPGMSRYHTLVDALGHHGCLRHQLRPQTGLDRWMRRAAEGLRGGTALLGGLFLGACCVAVGIGSVAISDAAAHGTWIAGAAAGTALMIWFVGALVLSRVLERNLFGEPAAVTLRGAVFVLVLGCVAWTAFSLVGLDWGGAVAAGVVGSFMLYELQRHTTS